ncbi:MAG: ABC transporter permease [Alphaproteobacteria bacterium]
MRWSWSLLSGFGLTALVAGVALISLLWTPYDPAALAVADRLQGPSWSHPMGTDALGRDGLSMVMVGAGNSLAVAFLAVGFGIGVGVPIGLAAAASRGPADSLLMRSNDVIFAFPALVLAILMTAVFGPGAVNAIIAIGIFNIPVFARLARGGALSLWSREYVLAAQVAGKGRARISAEHILPNIASLLIVQGTIQFSLGILAEAGLSYVGLGTQPPAPSWGRMLSDSQTLADVAPWLVIFPGFAIFVAVLGFNLLGDGLRDVLDPRLSARETP